MNQPAFPTGIITDDKGVIVSGSNGMSLRDYFAAKAMEVFLQKIPGITGTNLYEHRVATESYTMADAMMKAREA